MKVASKEGKGKRVIEVMTKQSCGCPKLPDSKGGHEAPHFGLQISLGMPFWYAKDFGRSRKAGKGRKNTYSIRKVSLCGGYGVDIVKLSKRNDCGESEAVIL